LNILTIDTSTSIELVAISSKNRVSDKTKVVGVSHSTTLFENIDKAINELNITIKDINLLGVGIGPGSFTGIRIAVSTARMLAQVLDVPLVGIKTHLIYACTAQANINENILIAFDAKKERVFGALYRKSDTQLNPIEIIEPGDYRVEFMVDYIDNNHRTLLIGDGVKKFYQLLNTKISNKEFLLKFNPLGEIACNLTEYLFQKEPDKYTDINRALPLYTRKSDAEIVKYSR